MRLYKHQEKAIEKARELRAAGCNRVAVVAPTGSGKTLEGVLIAKEVADDDILWITTREFIYNEQKESVCDLLGESAMDGITVITYMGLVKSMPCFKPKAIVCDEFHHIGADIWGAAVQELCELYPDVPVIGLSATPYRPSDGNRDMGEEFFGGNYAEKMFIWEAWADPEIDIWPPKYVSAVYTYEDELARIERRLAEIADWEDDRKVLRQYERMRRSLEAADGPEEIIAKHIDNPQGHYIFFCRSREHLQEMAGVSRRWFRKVNEKVTIYEIECGVDNPGEVVNAFTENDDDSLKVILAIDMLNEGLHCDCDGVIMARPTTSSTVFMQQLGRALEVGSNKVALVIDLVNNIESQGVEKNGKLTELGKSFRESRAEYEKRTGKEYQGPDFDICDESLECAEVIRKMNAAIDRMTREQQIQADIDLWIALNSEKAGR